MNKLQTVTVLALLTSACSSSDEDTIEPTPEPSPGKEWVITTTESESLVTQTHELKSDGEFVNVDLSEERVTAALTEATINKKYYSQSGTSDFVRIENVVYDDSENTFTQAYQHVLRKKDVFWTEFKTVIYETNDPYQSGFEYRYSAILKKAGQVHFSASNDVVGSIDCDRLIANSYQQTCLVGETRGTYIIDTFDMPSPPEELVIGEDYALSLNQFIIEKLGL